ncbi:MAG: DUF4105 domain-containing protein [Zoogloea sp.]|nr:DUF4105 domain-containing protein [Zoogloea sp.]
MPAAVRAGALLAIGVLLWMSGARADVDYLADLQRRAAESRLADHREWRVLLHYRRNGSGSEVMSDADDPRFFLAPGGKTDPAAELAATLAAFFSDDPVGADPQPAQCAFVARYEWLRQALDFDSGRLPARPCAAYLRWKGELEAEAATLVFTSAYLNNPASLFGHTLLRLDRRGGSGSTPLLAYAVGYAADDRGSKGLMYGIKGVSGGFSGYFELQSYDRLVRNYSDIENRDIWEYRLNFNADQMARLIAHLWELRGVRFDYFFFTENCAWQLLTLLEVADPSRDLSSRFVLWVAPADVLRLLSSEPGLVGAVTPRPARGSAIRRRYSALSAPERAQARALHDDVGHVEAQAFRVLPSERQALLLDLALDLRQRGGMMAGQGEADVPPDEGVQAALRPQCARSACIPLRDRALRRPSGAWACLPSCRPCPGAAGRPGFHRVQRTGELPRSARSRCGLCARSWNRAPQCIRSAPAGNRKYTPECADPDLHRIAPPIQPPAAAPRLAGPCGMGALPPAGLQRLPGVQGRRVGGLQHRNPLAVARPVVRASGAGGRTRGRSARAYRPGCQRRSDCRAGCGLEALRARHPDSLSMGRALGRDALGIGPAIHPEARSGTTR